MKKVLLVLVLFLFLIPITDVSSTTEPQQIPVVETIDLFIDGSTPVRINLTKDFDYVMRLIFELEYDDPSFIGTEFAENGPLVNGICICVYNSPLLDFNITINDHFARVAYDTTVFHDDKDPKNTHIFSRFSFFKFSPPFGLSYTNNDSLFFIVQDDMTNATYDITHFEIQVEGFRLEEILLAESFDDGLYYIDFLNNLALFLAQNWVVVLGVSAIIIILIKILFF